jgi:hypothetical protein
MFRTVPLSIIRSFYCTHSNDVCHTRLLTAVEQDQDVPSWSCLQTVSKPVCCQQTCMTYTIAVCTVKNSWWWTEELSETCRDSFQDKFEKLVYLVGFVIRICHEARSDERKIKNKWDISEIRVIREFFSTCRFGHACHIYDILEVLLYFKVL